MTNILQRIVNSTVVLLSLSTATSVLLHDTSIDKAVSSMYEVQATDLTSDSVKIREIRAGSNLHPHAGHLTVKKDARNPDMMPKKRVSKRIAQQSIRRMACGYHGDGVCMPLAGEWT